MKVWSLSRLEGQAALYIHQVQKLKSALFKAPQQFQAYFSNYYFYGSYFLTLVFVALVLVYLYGLLALLVLLLLLIG